MESHLSEIELEHFETLITVSLFETNPHCVYTRLPCSLAELFPLPEKVINVFADEQNNLKPLIKEPVIITDRKSWEECTRIGRQRATISIEYRNKEDVHEKLQGWIVKIFPETIEPPEGLLKMLKNQQIQLDKEEGNGDNPSTTRIDIYRKMLLELQEKYKQWDFNTILSTLGIENIKYLMVCCTYN